MFTDSFFYLYFRNASRILVFVTCISRTRTFRALTSSSKGFLSSFWLTFKIYILSPEIGGGQTPQIFDRNLKCCHSLQQSLRGKGCLFKLYKSQEMLSLIHPAKSLLIKKTPEVQRTIAILPSSFTGTEDRIWPKISSFKRRTTDLKRDHVDKFRFKSKS